MGATAAIISTVGAAHSSAKQSQAESRARREAKKAEEKMAEERRKAQEATPFYGMDTTRRIAAERLAATRSAGRGRYGVSAQMGTGARKEKRGSVG